MTEVNLEFWLNQERRIVAELAALQAAGLTDDLSYFDLMLEQLGQAQDAIHNITGERRP